MTKEELVYFIYKQFYKQFYEVNQAPINNESNQKLINNFFDRIGKHVPKESIGADFIERFIRFQWEYWIDKETHRRISLAWIIGTKAIKRWTEVEDWSTKAYFASKHTSAITVNIPQPEENNSYEEREKKRYHNTLEGFTHCIEETTLYSKCITCIKCKFKADCKKLLKENYPLLYKNRLK